MVRPGPQEGDAGRVLPYAVEAGSAQPDRGSVCVVHRRLRFLHFNVTYHPTAELVVQQLREAFQETGPYRYAFFDHDSTFNADVIAFLNATGRQPR